MWYSVPGDRSLEALLVGGGLEGAGRGRLSSFGVEGGESIAWNLSLGALL